MPLTITKKEIYQSNILIHLITVNYSQLPGCIILAFPYFFKYTIIKEAVITFIIKPILSKL